MRCVIQRVSRGSVEVEGEVVGEIDKGFVVLVGFTDGDTEEKLDWMARKIVGLRVFTDLEGKMNISLKDAGGKILAISQFTLYGNLEKGYRPSFIEAMEPKTANIMYEKFVEKLREFGVKVEIGIFGAKMKIDLVNEGPVTLILER